MSKALHASGAVGCIALGALALAGSVPVLGLGIIGLGVYLAVKVRTA